MLDLRVRSRPPTLLAFVIGLSASCQSGCSGDDFVPRRNGESGVSGGGGQAGTNAGRAGASGDVDGGGAGTASFPAICEPGEEEECACGPTIMGYRACAPDASSWTACICPSCVPASFVINLFSGGCAHTLPAAALGEGRSARLVDATFADPWGNEELLRHTDDCADDEGWRFDSMDAPTSIMLCASTCERASESGGALVLDFGCGGPAM